MATNPRVWAFQGRRRGEEAHEFSAIIPSYTNFSISRSGGHRINNVHDLAANGTVGPAGQPSRLLWQSDP